MSDNAERIADRVVDMFIDQRKALGFSHDKLAEKTKLHRSTISLIENKKRSPTLKNCIKIADALDLKLSDLLKATNK